MFDWLRVDAVVSLKSYHLYHHHYRHNPHAVVADIRQRMARRTRILTRSLTNKHKFATRATNAKLKADTAEPDVSLLTPWHEIRHFECVQIPLTRPRTTAVNSTHQTQRRRVVLASTASGNLNTLGDPCVAGLQHEIKYLRTDGYKIRKLCVLSSHLTHMSPQLY